MVMTTSMAALAVALATGQVTPPADPAAPVASEAQAAAPSSAEANTTDQQQPDIVVTAQRRSESAQRVPISLVALPAETLAKTNIVSVLDLPRVAPGFNAFRSAQAANTRLSIRGIGSPGNSAIEPSVGAYVDGIYIPRPGPLLAALNDVSSVEVLRGPQGTLFGRNASVGALSIHTTEPKPTDEAEGSIEAGNYGRVRGTAIANIGNQEAAARVALLYDRFDGYGYDLLRGQRIGRNATFSARGSLKANIAPNVTWLIRGDYQNQHGDGVSPSSVDASTVTPTFAANFAARLNGLIPKLDDTYSYALRQVSGGLLSDRQLGISSDFAVHLGDTTVRLISGYRDWHNHQSENDIPFTQAFLFGRDARYFSKAHSQELQIVSPEGRRLTAVGGLYYYRERYDIDTALNLGSDYCNIFIRNTAPTRLAACFAGPQANAGHFTFDQVTESLAAYGQATFKIAPWWDVTGGVRYTHDRKTGSLISVTPNSALASSNAPDNAPDLYFSGGRVTYRANTTFYPAKDVILYATVSTGYKSGGFDTGTGSTVGTAARIFQPETTTNYEVGVKSQFLDRRLTANATLFRMDIDNYQLRAFNGTFYVVRNAASVRQQGLEFDLSARPTNRVALGVSGTLLYAKYRDFPNAPPLPGLTGTQNLSGTRVSYSPKFQGTAFAEYRQPIGQLTAALNTHLGFTSDIDVGIGGDGNPQGIQPGYTLLGARLSLAGPGDRWELAVLGENLTGQGYCTTKYGQTLAGALGLAAGGQTVLRCILGEPRTVRGSVKVRF